MHAITWDFIFVLFCDVMAFLEFCNLIPMQWIVDMMMVSGLCATLFGLCLLLLFNLFSWFV